MNINRREMNRKVTGESGLCETNEGLILEIALSDIYEMDEGLILEVALCDILFRDVSM